jgi:hypothetical protein
LEIESGTHLATHPIRSDVALLGCSDGRCALIDIVSGTLLRVFETPRIAALQWAPDGRMAVVADKSGGTTVFGRSGGASMISIEQFFPVEVSESRDDSSVVLDSSGIPLHPQPLRTTLGDLRMEVHVRQVQIEVVEQEKGLLAKWRELGVGRSMQEAMAEPARPATPMVAFDEDDVGWADAPVAQHESDSSAFSTSDDGDATGHFELPTTRQRADVSRDDEEAAREDPLGSDRNFASDSEGDLYSSSSPEPRKRPLEPRKKPLADGSGDADFTPDTSESDVGPPHEKLPLVRPRKVMQKYATDSESGSEPGQGFESAPAEGFDEWCWEVEQHDYLYIPQLGDRVVYFRAGHHDAEKQDDSEAPYVVMPSMPDKAMATVVEVQFCVKFLLLTLAFDGDWRGKLEYPLPMTPSWLVLEQCYDRAMKFMEPLHPGDDLSAFFFYDNYKFSQSFGFLLTITDNWREQPFNAINVRWQDQTTDLMSPWELCIPDQEDMSQFALFCVDFGRELKKVLTAPQFRPLFEMRKRVEALIRDSLKPMDLNLLVERLDHKWYRSMQELLADIKWLAVDAEHRRIDPAVVAEFTAEITGLGKAVVKGFGLKFEPD